MTYVGSADNVEYDQVLEEALVGPIPRGTHKFVLEVSFKALSLAHGAGGTQPPPSAQASAPDYGRIDASNLQGMTVVLLTCSFRGQEFIRVGYYVDNRVPQQLEGAGAEQAVVKPEDMVRQVLADKARVTRFLIDWSGTADKNATGISATAAAAAEAEAGQYGVLHGGDADADVMAGEHYGEDEDEEEDDDDEGDYDLTGLDAGSSAAATGGAGMVGPAAGLAPQAFPTL